jgi:hypothetical protein
MKRTIDIDNRLIHARAERETTIPGSEQYNELTEVMQYINNEYINPDARAKKARYSFRLYNGHYHLIVLERSDDF